MLLPSLACPAGCAYCFGPNKGPVMQQSVLAKALEWIAGVGDKDRDVHLSFHGGEPLAAGVDWYRAALPAIRSRFNDKANLGVQSNLWLLNDEFCQIFKEYRVSISTSLDGPEAINDAQRGPGYYANNRRGVETAWRHGFGIGAICTFTQKSAPRWREVFDYFVNENMPFSVHSAVPSLGCPTSDLTLTAAEKAQLFITLFDHYMANMSRIKISTFDTMARSISCGEGGLCTFNNCLGHYLTIAPDGGIFSCNRFAHDNSWRLGFVQELPSLEELSRTPVWRKLAEREELVKEDCGDCPHFGYCHGGCVYNAMSGGSDRRDPLCEGYKRIFEHITDRALEQVFSDENMNAVIQDKNNGHGLLKKGPLLQVMRGGPHPQQLAARARETVSCAALAQTGTVEGALQRLQQFGLVTNPQTARGSLQNLWNNLHDTSRRLVNAYIHVTYKCNLACAHCYAGNADQHNSVLPLDKLQPLIAGAAGAGFGKVVITGGEPLMVPKRKDFLADLAQARRHIKPALLVLRTNLAMPLSAEELSLLSASVDQIVVSIDGDKETHDARRGRGSYEAALGNIRSLLALKKDAELSLAAVLTPEQNDGAAGESVRKLGEELGVPVRFKPLLPLGRAAGLSLPPEFDTSLYDDVESIANIRKPASTCGLGMNLYIAPDGATWPCYAVMGETNYLGNVFTDNWDSILNKNDRYLACTVDSNRGCRACMLKYICGGFCRAWTADGDPDAPLPDCSALYHRALKILENSLEVLNINRSFLDA
ncbi:MAG TPA: TIGR04083 family peptide-modifying radical SAM enzyme [bacterium]|nr:TIGR04083 family peptide-modifying radical SAM enzyme [bacterium]HPN44350.1 TIGR04083 family peptide-modifying radical SAM enzyme [bacterium]